MKKEILVCAAIGLAAIFSRALAQDLSSPTAPLPPGTFTTSAHSDEWKIANALSAGPASITEHATVMDWPANPKDGLSHGRALRQGTNGGTCLPDPPGKPQRGPMCNDETMMKWLAATLAGEKPDIDRVGLEAELYTFATTGKSITSFGIGTKGKSSGSNPATGGTTAGGKQVSFSNDEIFLRDIASQIGADERAHVVLLRGALGSAACAMPNIDLGALGFGFGKRNDEGPARLVQ